MAFNFCQLASQDKKQVLKTILKKFIAGQIIALCLALTGISQTNLENFKFNNGVEGFSHQLDK